LTADFIREDNMLPSEMIILMAIVVNGKISRKLLSRPLDISSEYIGYLYNSLVNRGYLKHRGADGYQLTPTGRETIFDFLKKNKTMSQEIVKRLQMLGIAISPEQAQKIYQMEKEAVQVR
jgi:predicted transcriptional regulator